MEVEKYFTETHKRSKAFSDLYRQRTLIVPFVQPPTWVKSKH